MTTQPSSPFDISSMFKLYKETIDLWKKDYENFLKGALLPADSFNGKRADVESITSAYDAALLDWQKSGDELFKRFVQNQIELCHFFGNCWEQYLKLPEQLSQCRSLTELGNLQSSFLNQFARDYMQETEKLAKPVADLARQVKPHVRPRR
jgi:hypothetical protein